jgi:endonuclease YncB( thermonuclease family)
MRAHFVGLAFSTVRSLRIVAAAALAAALSVASAQAVEVEVVSGDVIRLQNAEWRIANIDAPQIENTCADEARLGVLAQAKLAEFVGQGEMEIAPTGRVDKRNRRTARVRVNGEDVGEKMIAAGLAQRYGSARPLCVADSKDTGHLPPTMPVIRDVPGSRHMN